MYRQISPLYLSSFGSCNSSVFLSSVSVSLSLSLSRQSYHVNYDLLIPITALARDGQAIVAVLLRLLFMAGRSDRIR